MDEKLTIGQRIGKLRGHESQQELADAIGVPRSTVRNWELDIREPKASAIFKLADHFNVSSDYIVGLAGDPTADKYKRAAIESLGLSQTSIEKLSVLKNYPEMLLTANLLFSSPMFLTFLSKLCGARIAIQILQESKSGKNPVTDMHDLKQDDELIELYLFRIQKAVYEYLEQVIMSGEFYDSRES